MSGRDRRVYFEQTRVGDVETVERQNKMACSVKARNSKAEGVWLYFSVQ